MSFNIPARIWSVHFITVSIIILFLFELVCKNKNSNESCVSHQSVCVHTVQSLAIKAIMAHGKTKRNTRYLSNELKDKRRTKCNDGTNVNFRFDADCCYLLTTNPIL